MQRARTAAERDEARALRVGRGDLAMQPVCRARLARAQRAGLAPLVVQEIYEAFARIRADGLAIVLVEQDVARACEVTDQLVCMLKGRVTLAGASDAFDHARIAAAYFGEK